MEDWLCLHGGMTTDFYFLLFVFICSPEIFTISVYFFYKHMSKNYQNWNKNEDDYMYF